MIIGWFSCGITSAVACKMALELYEDVELFYIETGSAHEDNKRFISDCENWYGKKINIIKNSKGYENVIDVIYKIRYVNGVGGASCTLKLKKEVRYDLEKKYTKDLFNNIEYYGQVWGFEFERKQVNRAIRFMEQYPETKPLFPLIEKGITKNNCAAMIINAGIELPVMYKLGYPNNNCIGCVKGGKGYWNKIRIDFPEQFEEMIKAERYAGHSCINGTFLDELNPNDGRESKIILPNCSTICDVEFADLPDKSLDEIMKGYLSIYDFAKIKERGQKF